MNNQQKFDWPLWLKLSAVLTFALILMTVAAYFINFNGSFSDQEQFGQFGDFIGGLLNPILTFFTICLLIWSIRYQVNELELTRNELKQSGDALNSAQEAHHKSYALQLNEVKRVQLQEALNQEYEDFEFKWTRSLITVGNHGLELSLEDIFDLHKHSSVDIVKQLVGSVTDRMANEPRYQNEVQTIVLKDLKEILRRICRFTQEIYENIESPPIGTALYRKVSQLNDKMLSISVLTDNEYNINKAIIRLPNHLNDLL